MARWLLSLGFAQGQRVWLRVGRLVLRAMGAKNVYAQPSLVLCDSEAILKQAGNLPGVAAFVFPPIFHYSQRFDVLVIV